MCGGRSGRDMRRGDVLGCYPSSLRCRRQRTIPGVAWVNPVGGAIDVKHVGLYDAMGTSK